MRVLIFEWMTGGGMHHCGQTSPANDPMLHQGTAMFSTLSEDFIAAGHNVVAVVDDRVAAMEFFRGWDNAHDHFHPTIFNGRRSQPNLPELLRSLAQTCDLIVIIAPESDAILSQCYRWLIDYQCQWWGGPLEWIELASDKNRTQRYLRDHGIAVPPQTISPGQRWVAKPVHGAGSEQVQIFAAQNRLREFQENPQWRVESFIAGTPVSVTVIDSPEGHFFLPPTGQQFAVPDAGTVCHDETDIGKSEISKSDDCQNDNAVADGIPIGHYAGAVYPLSRDLADRAQTLARKTVEVLPNFSGYLGIDMVLADDGRDVVVELNPRMTMSYCHLPVDRRRGWITF